MLIEDKFGIADDEYWTDPWRTKKDLQRPLVQKGEETFFIGAPNTVALNAHTTFPVAILRVRKLLSADRVDFRATAIMTAIELNSSQLSAGRALPPKNRAASRNEAPKRREKDSFSNDQTAMVAEGSTLDLAARLGLPATRGEYLVTLICLDKVSNRCRMKLIESAGYQDPAVEEFFSQHAASLLELPEIFPRPGAPFPDYERRKDSPPLPAEPGIALAVERVNVIRPVTQCVLKGSFRLPIRPQHLVKPVASQPDAQAVVTRTETAVVPITLLLTGSVDPAPKIIELAVPSYERPASFGTMTIATGHFAIDLCQLTDVASKPQTYFIYAFAGEVMTDPVPVAFVSMPRVHWKAR